MKDILKVPGTVEFDVELLKTEINNERVKYLVNSITDKEATLKELEAELECVVCLETGSSPLYCCQEQHLVCSSCMPGVRRTGKCPSCRAPYPGGDLLRHRFAERTAERLGALRQELTKLRAELDENLS